MRRGITLIECLVCLAIVAVLVALFLPLFVSHENLTPTEQSTTFAAKVINSQDEIEEDQNGDFFTAHYVNVDIFNGSRERLTIDEGLAVTPDDYYTFRVWNTDSLRHASEAILIPKGLVK